MSKKNSCSESKHHLYSKTTTLFEMKLFMGIDHLKSNQLMRSGTLIAPVDELNRTNEMWYCIAILTELMAKWVLNCWEIFGIYTYIRQTFWLLWFSTENTHKKKQTTRTDCNAQIARERERGGGMGSIIKCIVSF